MNKKISRFIVFFILFLFIWLHLFLISKTFLYDEEGNMKAAIGGYGDIPFHLTQVTKFGYGDLFDFNEPIFTGDRIRYAFLINWISGLFLKITGHLRFSLLLPAMIFAVASIILTFLIYKKLLKKEWLALLAVLIFFLGSGFASYYLITDKIIGESMSLSQFINFVVEKNITTIVKWDAVYPQQNITWGAPLTMAFMHQRSFFLGYFLFTLFLYLLLKFQETKNKKIFYALILILGLSPLAHYHSFLAMGFTTVLFAIIQFWKKDKELFKKTVLILILAAIISLPEIIYLVSGKENIVYGENAFIKFRLGWMTDPTIGSVKYPNENPGALEKITAYKQFLWINFGLILPVFILASFWLMRKKIKAGKEVVFYISGAIFFFVLAQLFKFQPWDYDNNKILVYFQFFAAPIIILFFLKLIEKNKKAGAVLLGLFFIVAIHSGIIDIIPRYLVPIKDIPVIFNKDNQQTAEYIKENIPENEQILTSSTHLNPVDSLAGRPAIVGYPGWLWTKGLDYTERERDIKSFYSNPNRADIIEKYNLKYILLDPMAIYDWKTQKEIFDAKFPIVFSNNSFTLYKIGSL